MQKLAEAVYVIDVSVKRIEIDGNGCVIKCVRLLESNRKISMEKASKIIDILIGCD